VFIHRNVGNLVPGNDLNALSVLEYAVEFLGVTDIIVTGKCISMECFRFVPWLFDT
jgi:carbonic anhydrase